MVGNTLRKGLSPSWKGQKLGPANITDEERERRRINAVKVFEPFKFQKGHKPWCTGVGNPHIRGDKNYNWKGGSTVRNSIERRAPEYKKWRMWVLVRDNFTCQMCGAPDSFTADHIKSFAKHPELRTDLSNGRTLCLDCHKKTPSYLK